MLALLHNLSEDLDVDSMLPISENPNELDKCMYKLRSSKLTGIKEKVSEYSKLTEQELSREMLAEIVDALENHLQRIQYLSTEVCYNVHCI